MNLIKTKGFISLFAIGILVGCGTSKDEGEIEFIAAVPYHALVIGEQITLNPIAFFTNGTTKSLTSAEITLTIDEADQGKVIYDDNFNLTFTEAKDYHITMSYISDSTIQVSNIIQVYDEESKIDFEAKSLMDMDELVIANSKIKPAANSMQTKLNENADASEIYQYLKDNGGTDYNVNVNMNVASKITFDGDDVHLRFKYHTLFKVLHNGTPIVELDEFSFVAIDNRTNECINFAGKLSIPALRERGYTSVFGKQAGEEVDMSLSMLEYNYLITNVPDALIHRQELNFLIFGNAGTYELICDIVDVEDYTHVFYTQKNLLKIA